MLLRLLTAAALLAGLAPAASAGEKLVQKVYAVADLIVPIPDCTNTDCPKDGCAPPATPKDAKTGGADLIKLIESTVASRTWANVGGAGTIDYYPVGMALVVTQTPDVQEEIANLLEALRRLQEREIAFEVRFVHMAESALEGVGLGANQGADATAVKTQVRCEEPGCRCLPMMARWQPQQALLLTNQQVFQFLEALQHGHSCVMQAPKVTAFDGQKVCVRIGESRHFVTDVKEMTINGQVVFVPAQMTAFIGTDLGLQGSITPDGKQVCTHISGSVSSLDPLIPLVPMKTFVTPIFEGGGQGQPIPHTQFVQKPRIEKIAVEKTLAIPDGGTALIYCGPFTAEGRNEFGPPVLSKIPYINRLFKNVGYGRTSGHLVMLVTAKARTGAAEEQVDKGTCSGLIGTAVGSLSGQACDQPCKSAPAMTKPSTAFGKVLIGEGVNTTGGLAGTIVVNERNCDVKCCRDKEACSLAEIVQLTQAGLSEDVIINQIHTTKARYTLAATDIIMLHKHGVGARVILEMQCTRLQETDAVNAPCCPSTSSYAPGPNERMEQLLNESEDVRELPAKSRRPIYQAPPASSR